MEGVMSWAGKDSDPQVVECRLGSAFQRLK